MNELRSGLEALLKEAEEGHTQLVRALPETRASATAADRTGEAIIAGLVDRMRAELADGALARRFEAELQKTLPISESAEEAQTAAAASVFIDFLTEHNRGRQRAAAAAQARVARMEGAAAAIEVQVGRLRKLLEGSRESVANVSLLEVLEEQKEAAIAKNVTRRAAEDDAPWSIEEEERHQSALPGPA